jgi:cell division protein FtsW
MKEFFKKIIRKYHEPDYSFIVILTLVILVGLVFLTSASSVVGLKNFGSSIFFLKHQLLNGLLPGLILLFVLSFLDYRHLKKNALPLFILSVILLLLVFVPHIGYGRGDSRRWITALGLTFQPSELTKLALVIYLAALFDRQKKKIKTWRGGLLPVVIIFLIVAAIILIQKDLGTLIVIFVIVLGIYYLAGSRWFHWGILFGGAVALFLIMILAVPYRFNRFLTFFYPNLNPLGIGYQINQSLIAIGSGGLFGLGLGHSRQKYFYLPEAYGDSIFAVMAEEVGFFLVTLVLFLFFSVFLRGLRIAKRAPDFFGQLVAGGISIWFLTQLTINVGSMLHLFPLTGVPLPFVSYGGSSMMIFLAAFGILINISRQTQE